MSLPGLTVNAGPEAVSLACFQGRSTRAAEERDRLVREADETQRRLRAEFYERQNARAA